MTDNEKSCSLTQTIDIKEIVVPLNWREIDETVMPGLMDSISTIGLLHPILVTPNIVGKYELVGGRHRLEAHIRLNYGKIAARVLSREQASMARPSENYHRAAYSELDASEDMIAYRDARREWTDDREKVALKGGVQPNDKGNSRTARLFGTTAKRVRKAEAHASICAEAKSVLRSTGKKQTVVALDRIASLPSRREQIAEAMLLLDTEKGASLAKQAMVTVSSLFLAWEKSDVSKLFTKADENVKDQFIAKLKPPPAGQDWA